MSETFTKKNLRLWRDFDKYLTSKPELYDKIPNKGTIIFTIKGDSYFNRCSRDMAREAKGRDGKFVEARKEGKKWELYQFKY